MTVLSALGLLAAGAAVGAAVVFAVMRLTQARMRDSFQSLSAQALRDNNTQFLDNARRMLDDIARQSRSDIVQNVTRDVSREVARDMDTRRDAVENLVRPVQEALGVLQGEIRKMEGRREEAFTGLQGEIARLQKETSNLTTALRRPQGRGLWGEITLRRVVEAAGMSPHCDFSEQATLEDREGRRYRPDLIVHLPGKHQIVVDSKTPLDAYLDAVGATTDEARALALVRHASQVRKQMELLSSKEYWNYLETSPDFVVLFLPGESFFSAALEQDRTLIEDAIERKVILATPTTLIALLKAVAYGWRQEQVAENARLIGELGTMLYERLTLLTDHLRDVGSSLDKAVASYNKAIGSYNARVLVTARQFRSLETTHAPEIPPVEEIEKQARTGELSQQTLDLR